MSFLSCFGLWLVGSSCYGFFVLVGLVFVVLYIIVFNGSPASISVSLINSNFFRSTNKWFFNDFDLRLILIIISLI